jgi:hypothetical protein
MPFFFYFFIYFSFHIRLIKELGTVHVGSHHTILYDERAFVSGIAGIIRITSHSCDEAGAGWVLAWNW